MDLIAIRRARALPMRAALFCAAALMSGCYGYGAVAVAGPEAPDVPLDQTGRGEKLYAEGCAGCHGEHGEGSEGRPALIGEKALPLAPPEGAAARKGEMKSAADLHAFIKSDMPPIAPGSLTDDEAWAITAFLLKEGGRAPAPGPDGDIGPKNAPLIPIHR